jgi:hypothetical protein
VNASIISRCVINIAIKDGSRINQLYISIDPEFFESCFRNPDFDIRVRDNDFASSTPAGGEHISKNFYIKNRSIDSTSESTNKSNFCKNNSVEKLQSFGDAESPESIESLKSNDGDQRQLVC